MKGDLGKAVFLTILFIAFLLIVANILFDLY